MGAAPTMNPSAKGGARSSLQYGGEGVLIHPPHQGVCGRHGTEEQRVTSGGLAESPGGTGVSRPISGSERASADGREEPRAFQTGPRYVSCHPEQPQAVLSETKEGTFLGLASNDSLISFQKHSHLAPII